MSLQSVVLNVYDLQPEQNDFLYQFGLGLFHSGVVVGGNEWTFAGGGGVFCHPPKQAGGARFRESIDFGSYGGTTRDLDRVLDDLRETFKGENYHILTQNCNNFAEALLLRLVNKPIPGFVNRMAFVGSFFSCLLPPALANEAPVNSSGGTRSAPGKSMPNPFAGAGRILSEHAPSGEGTISGGDQSERKEKIRQAALSRMQQQPSQM